MTVIFNGNIEIVNVGDGASVNFGNIIYFCPKSISTSTQGSGGGSGAYVIENSLYTVNNTYNPSVVNQPSTNGFHHNPPIKKINKIDGIL